MCNKSGSPPVPNQTSTAYQSATAPSAFVQPYYQGFLQNAQQLSQTPFNPAMLGQVAPMNAAQNQAGTQLFELGMNLGSFDPNAVSTIQSPFMEDVVKATQDWFNNQNRIQGNDLIGQAIRSGNAFGGDRAGIAEAQLAGQQQLAQAPVIAGLRQAGYTQALDEYNRLKQMGITGAGTALGWGTLAQQQQQREMDVAQQNAMMASAYPFQTANWYGSTLGGIGPLLGSFAQGYTTPPQPNELTQGLGIASSLIGLGTSLFGKDGGVVGRKVGGLVPIVVARRNGGLVPVAFRDGGGVIHLVPPSRPPRRQTGGLVPVWGMYRGGLIDRRIPRHGLGRRLPPKRQYGGGISLSTSGDDDDTGPTTHSFNLDQLNIPTFKGPPDAGSWIQQRMRDTAREQKKPANPTADAIDAISGIAKKAAPMLALMALKSGGRVGYYADGDDVDDDDNEAVLDTGADDVSREDMPRLIQTAYAAPGAAAYRPSQPQVPVVAPAPAADTAAPAAPAAAAPAATTAAVNPESFWNQPPPPGGRTFYGGRTADTGGGRAGETTVIPGLGPPPRTFAQRWATNPFTQAGAAMLMSRSPYFGPGVGAGMLAASGSIEQQRKEDLLENKPQMIDDGQSIKYRVGNRIIDSGITSPKARAAQERRDVLEYQEGKRTERQQIRSGGRPSGAQAEATNRFHMRALQKQLEAIKDDPDRVAKARQIIQDYNNQWGTNFNVPAAPAPETEGAAPSGEGFWNWLWRGITGASAPAKPAAAAAAESEPDDEGQAAPAAPRGGRTGAAAIPTAPAAPAAEAPQDLATALDKKTITKEQAISQARAAAKRDPSKIDMITKRLRDAGIKNFGDLLQGSPATPAR